ncbi:MAG: exopolysaccharide biosynthesis polyprenyl glycosylphosphotransferase [Anaerolineae bacterium]
MPTPRQPRFQLQVSERRALLIAGDLIAVNTAVLVALRIWAVVGQYDFDLAFLLPRLYWFPLLSLLWITLAGLNGFFDLRASAQFSAMLPRLVLVTLQLLVVYVLIFFLSPPETLPRLFILYYAVASFFLILLWRSWRPFLMGWSGFRRRVLVVGTDWAAQTIIETLNAEMPQAYEIVGLIGAPEQVGRKLEGAPVLGSGRELAEIAMRENAREVIVATHRELPADVFEGIMDCYERGITITPMPLLYERLTGRVPVEHVGNQWAIVLPLKENSLFNLYPVFKRLLDVALASIGLGVFALMLPVIVVAMQLDSPGPVFYVQERLGKAGRVFRVFKLRSMIPDAEKDSGPLWATENDPRITAVGRILRKTRLDELPQLLNVLRGEMSMIGPRPERPEFVAALADDIPFYRTRLVVKPGLTGWAQVRYRYGSTRHDALVKLQYDLYYIRHQSLLLDMVILFRTIGKVLTFQGT